MAEENIKIQDLKTIGAETIAKKGVQALSDTPNRVSRYGQAELTAPELKRWFDQLVGLAIDRINEIITVLKDGDLASEISIKALGTISTVQALADAVTSGVLWKLLKIPYIDSGGRDATMSASDKIDDIVGMFAGYVSSVEYDTTEHKIKISKGGSETGEAISPAIVEEGILNTLIAAYAKLNDATQDITAQNITANSVKADSPDTDGKYLVNRTALGVALNGLRNEVMTAISQAVSSVYVYKGSVENYTDLPTNASNGHVYNVVNAYKDNPAGTNYVCSDGGWEVLTGIVDTSKFLEKLSGKKRVYVTDGAGNSSSIGYDVDASPSTIPVRDGEGRVKTYTPVANEDAANKEYVEEYVDTKLEGKMDVSSFYTDAPFTIGVRNDLGYFVTLAADYGRKYERDTVPLYSDDGRLSCANPTYENDAVNLKHLNGVIGNLSEILSKLHGGTV